MRAPDNLGGPLPPLNPQVGGPAAAAELGDTAGAPPLTEGTPTSLGGGTGSRSALATDPPFSGASSRTVDARCCYVLCGGLPHQGDQLFGGSLDAVAQHLEVGNGVVVAGHPAGQVPRV